MHAFDEATALKKRLLNDLQAGYPVKKQDSGTDTPGTELDLQEVKSSGFYGINRLDKESMAILMGGVVEYSEKNADKSPFHHREAFINYLCDMLTEGNAPKFPAEMEAERAVSPKNAAISARDLLGIKGLELYRLALEEEMHSFQYRMAVFNESTVHVTGEQFKKRPVVFIGGPSGCGKSYAADAIRLKICELLPGIPGDKRGNTFVSVDGGEVRKVSQIRKLLIRAANLQGFTGVSDLHAQSSILENVKFIVEAAAWNNKEYPFCIIRPETFSNWWLNKELYNTMKKVSNSEDSELIFSMVIGEDKENFQRVVEYMGENRAWKAAGFTDLTLDSLDLNETEKGLKESKEYGSMGFWFGKIGSNEAFTAFKFLQENNYKPFLSFEIVNDLVLLAPAKDDVATWEPAKPDSENVVIVSKKVYEDWKALKERDSLGCPDLLQYRNTHKITHLLMSPSLKAMEIDKQAKLMPEKLETIPEKPELMPRRAVIMPGKLKKMQIDAENPIKLYLVGKSLDEAQMEIATYFSGQFEKFQCDFVEGGFSFAFMSGDKRIVVDLLFKNSFEALDALPEYRSMILCDRENMEGRNEVSKNIPSLDWTFSANPSPEKNPGLHQCLDCLMQKIEKMALEYPFHKLDLKAIDIDSVIKRVAVQEGQQTGWFQKKTPATLVSRFNQFNGDPKTRLLQFLKDPEHGRDQYSFKFKVVSELTGCQASTKKEAMALIDLLTDKIERESVPELRPQSWP